MKKMTARKQSTGAGTEDPMSRGSWQRGPNSRIYRFSLACSHFMAGLFSHLFSCCIRSRTQNSVNIPVFVFYPNSPNHRSFLMKLHVLSPNPRPRKFSLSNEKHAFFSRSVLLDSKSRTPQLMQSTTKSSKTDWGLSSGLKKGMSAVCLLGQHKRLQFLTFIYVLGKWST